MQAETSTTTSADPTFGRDRNDDLRTMLALHAIALGTMSHGLCIFGADDRLVLFNKRFLEIMNLSSDTVRAGMSFRAVLELGVACGRYSRATFNKTWRECQDKLSFAKPFALVKGSRTMPR